MFYWSISRIGSFLVTLVHTQMTWSRNVTKLLKPSVNKIIMINFLSSLFLNDVTVADVQEYTRMVQVPTLNYTLSLLCAIFWRLLALPLTPSPSLPLSLLSLRHRRHRNSHLTEWGDAILFVHFCSISSSSLIFLCALILENVVLILWLSVIV